MLRINVKDVVYKKDIFICPFLFCENAQNSCSNTCLFCIKNIIKSIDKSKICGIIIVSVAKDIIIS